MDDNKSNKYALKCNKFKNNMIESINAILIFFKPHI